MTEAPAIQWKGRQKMPKRINGGVLVAPGVYERPDGTFLGRMQGQQDTERVFPTLSAAQQWQQDHTATPAPALRSAGHKRSATPATRKDFSKQQELDRLRKRVRALEALKREGSQGFLYLIGMEFQTLYPSTEAGKVYIWTHAVKIGWSEAPDARIASLQTGNPQKLVLLATKPGTLDDERALHAKYLPDNVLQEWFRPTMALLLEFGLRQTLRGEDRLLVEGVVTQP